MAASNYLHCRITGEARLRFLNLCKNHGFHLTDIHVGDEGLELNIPVSEFKKLRPLIRKTHVKIHILNRHGPAFFFYRHPFRLWFLCGLCAGAALIWYLSLFVWQIDISGNQLYTDERILQSLRTMNVTTGRKKSELDLSAIEEELRILYNQMTWVSASITGTQLKIETKEGNLQSSGTKQASEAQEQPSDLTAAADATITEIVVRHGTALVKTGDTVQKGDVLVEGKVYIYNDDATLKKIDYTCADADILADYEAYYQQNYPRQYQKRNYSDQFHRAYTLCLGSRRVSLPDFYQQSSLCEEWRWQKQFRLTPTFYLPFAIEITEYRPYTFESASYTDEELKKMAETDLENYFSELMKKGVQIIGNSVKIFLDDNGCTMSGTLSLNGPIGTDTPIDSSQMASN